MANNVIVAALAAACLFIRSCWRVVELSGGFNGPLASKEKIFIALDSVPMTIMTMLLTIMHPKLWFENRRLKQQKGCHLLTRDENVCIEI